MATHSSILAWRIPWTEEPGGLQLMGSQSWTQLKRLTMLVYEAKRKNHLSMQQGKPVLFHRLLREHIHAVFTSSLNIAAPSSTVYSAFLQINFFLN